jgi:hypothetical protein
MLLAGILGVVALRERSSSVEAEEERRGLEVEVASLGRSFPAYVGTWRHSANGAEAVPLMNLTNTSMPGIDAQPHERPFVRLGVCVAAAPVGRSLGASELRGRLVGFLSRGVVRDLVGSIAQPPSTSWIGQAGNGVFRVEAVLPGEDASLPAASAMLMPPSDGDYGRPDGVACFWLHLTPAGPRAGFRDWYARFADAVALGPAFESFLWNDLGLRTLDDPSARVCVYLSAPRSIADDLVDPESLTVLPGGYPSGQFLGYALADRAGEGVHDVARDLLMQLCDYTLHLDGAERVIRAL